MNKLRRALFILAIAFLLSLPTGGVAFAKITEEPVACEVRGGGNEPPGQQPECKGGGLDQESENQNPTGKAPPGQNK